MIIDPRIYGSICVVLLLIWASAPIRGWLHPWMGRAMSIALAGGMLTGAVAFLDWLWS